MDPLTFDPKGHVSLTCAIVDIALVFMFLAAGQRGWAIGALVLAILNAIIFTVKQATSS